MFPLRSWLDNIDTFGYFHRGSYSIVLPTGAALFNWDGVDFCLGFKDKLGNHIFTNDRVFVENCLVTKVAGYASAEGEEQNTGFYANVLYDKINATFFMRTDAGEKRSISAYTAKYSTVVGNVYQGG